MVYQRYIERKAKGVVSVRKTIDSVLEVVLKQFDQDTGEEVGEGIVEITIPRLEEERDILLAELDNVNALIADIRALK